MDTGDAQAKNGRKKRGAKKNKQQAGVRGNYVLPHILKENDSFFNYVRAQNIVSEDELEQFKTILKTDLPASFRINRSLPEKDEFVKFLKSKFFEPLRQIEDPEIHCPEEIEFVPYAYQTSNSRSAIRSSHLLSDLHQLLITETAAGNISRQEAVSMLPPLLLDVQPHHWVLDSCASPGSKTMQICEMMHEGNNKPEGLLVANDVDNSRCYLLVHQTLKRLPTANCVIVNHDASMLPAPLDSDGNPRLFDRVLCDVICSGDGTFRKNVELWKQWNPNKGVALHKLQQNIASRCLELLKPDGLMVYSTCSLNPIEDEAVVARLLKKFDGCLELVDVSDQLPKLKRANGVSTWKVFSSRMVEYATYEEAQKAGDKSIVPSMFPPTVEEAEKLHLNRSFRILPHVHNTGGFFIAVIRKVKEFSENLNPTPTSVARRVPAKKRRTVKEDPFVFLTNNCDDLKKSLVENYGADESFPWSNLLSRNENMDKKNAVYFVNDALRDFLKFNLERFNVVNAGVNTFRKVDKIGCCDFRLAQDSISTILPYIHKRIIDLDSDTVAKIIAGHDDKHFCPLDQLDFKDKLTGYSPGTVILRMQTAGFTKAISAWLGSLTVSAFISREEKVHLLTMLGKDTSKLQTVLSTSRRQKSDKQRNTTNENNTKNGDEEAMDVEVVKEKVKEEVKEEKMDYDQNPDYIQELLKRIDLNGLGEKKAVNVKLRETNGRKLKEQKRCVVVRSFEPTDDLRSSTELPLLRLEVGDRVLVVKVVGEWAVGRQEHNANSDFGMFPLHYVLPLSSNISCLEAEVLDTADRWLHYNRQLYIHNGSKVEYQKGVELINRLLEFLKIRNTNSNDVISFIDEGNTFFGAGVSLRRERDFTVAPEDFNIISAVEFIEKRQYRKELIAKNEGQRISTSSYHSDFSLQSQQSFTSLLLRFKGKRLVEEMFELDAQILDKKGLPIYETFWVTKLLEDEFWILLQDFPTTNDLQLQICGYELSWQELPGQLSDEFLHTRLNAALTSNISLSTTHNNTSFKRCVELKRMHKQPTTIDTTEQLQSQIQIKLYGEVIASSSIFELSSYLEKRKLRCIRLTPFVSSTLRSDKKSENRNSAHFSFDFFDYLKEFKRMEVIVQVVDSNGKQQKDALMTILNSTRKNTSDELLFYNYKVGSSKEQHPHVLNVQIRLPTEENCTLYLRLLLNVIVNDGKHNKTQQLHLAFVKVVDSGLLVESGKTNLLIYKVNSVANLNRLHYAKLVDRKQHDKVKHESTTTIDGFTLLDLHVPTQIVAFSQIYTQDPNVLFLLNSVDFQQQNAMEKAIENLCAVSSDFSIFIPRIFGRLFTKIGTVEKLDKKLFDFVCYAMLRAENPEEAHLKSVIAKEIEKIDNPMIFRPFLNQLIGALTADLVSTVEIKRWIEMLEITSQLVELIIKSYFVFADTNDEFEVSVVHEELENSFHLLLTTIINRLDDNLMNNKCTIVKNLPLMFNSLLLHEMVTPEFLVNFSIDLVKRIPVDMFVIRIQTVRSIIKSDLFDGQSHYCLASTLIPEIGSCLEKASNQPVALFSLLNTTIATLSDLMSKLTLMLTSSNGECNARETFVHVVDSTFSLIIQNCTFDNYNGCKDIQSRSQYLFASMLEFMDVTVFTHYLNHLPSTTDVQVLLCQIIYALRSLIEPSTRTTFNDPSIRWIFNRLVVKMFEYLRSCLIDKRTLPTFSLALWKELLHCIHAFMISTVSRMAFGIYDERNARLRLTVAELIRSLWFLLPFSLKKTNLRNMLEMLIDLLCSGCTRQIRIILMPIFSDLIATAYAESEGVIATGIDDLYKILHHRLLSHKRKKRKADEDSTITTEMNFEVQSMIESAPELNKNAKIRLLPKYLSLIEYGRQALVKKSTYQFEIVHSELVSFALQINEQSLTTELRIKIYNFQNDRGLFVEAAIGLQKCANGLSWHAKPLDSDAKFINQRMKLSCETESELKLTLYRMSIDLFQRAQAWELAIESLKELATYYEETTVDYKQLTEILNQMRLNYQKIVETIRVESFYFLVCFYGQRFPKYLQNKRYVMRGMERFGNFRQRITREFGCELITNLDAKPEELEQKRGKYVKLTTVVPVPSEKYQEMSKAANPLVSWYYKHHFVDTFDFLRPVQQKQTKWTNLKENDATKAWFQRTRYKIGFQLPNALSFGEVIEEIELERLNPPQVACKTINEANEQLKWLTKLVHNGFQDTHVTTQLVGQVRGILQAFVGGGIQNYTAFLSADEHIELDAGEKQDIEELRQLLIKQVELLDQALCAHGKCVTNETRQFHDTLVESFYEFRRTVQEICTCECKRIAVQKTGSKSNSSFETESTISDFSNSLTLPPRLSDRHSIN